MKAIKFSHEYPKLHGQTSAELLAVHPLDAHTPRSCWTTTRPTRAGATRTGESMLIVKCPMQVWATPDMAKTCNHYRRKATGQ